MPAIVRPDDGRFADQFTLSVEAEDESGIRAAVFFIDYNTNGIWDNGFDKPLGDVFTPSGNRFSLTVTASADWPVVSQIGYNVVGNDGVWASARTRIVQVDAPPVVMSAIAMPINSNTIRVRARVSDYGYQLSPAGAVGAVSYFYDANRNGLWDPGTDIDLGVMQLNESTAVEGWWQSEFAASAIGGLPTDQNPKYLVVNARDQRVIVGSDPSGSFGREFRVAVRTDIGDPKLVPHVYQAPYTASITPPRERWIVQGTTLTITPKAIAPSGTGATQELSRIDAYFDLNRNGLDDDGPNGGASTPLASFILLCRPECKDNCFFARCI